MTSLICLLLIIAIEVAAAFGGLNWMDRKRTDPNRSLSERDGLLPSVIFMYGSALLLALIALASVS